MAQAIISEEEVRRALAGVLSSQGLARVALTGLDSVTERLHERPVDNAEARAWALQDLLHHLTRIHLLRLRSQAHISSAAGPEAEEDAASALPVDFSAGSVDLEAWSCLYFRYLAMLPLRVQEIAALVLPTSPHGRKTVTRRLKRGYTLLANALRSQETKLAQRREAQGNEAADAARAADPATPGPASPPSPSRLPAPTSRFFGRHRELEQLRATLTRSRQLTLTGVGGVGKTRLALELARSIESRFEHGACFVDLSALVDARLIPPTIFDAVATEATSDRSPARLCALLEPQEILLVLDNCEHLLEDVAALCRRLLAAAPRLHILATSRSPLALPGEQTWRLAPLPLPEPEADAEPARVATVDSVALFVDRARCGRQGFALTATNVAAVSAICRRLDGIALAIELAAARVRVLSPEQILQRLDDRFALLTGAPQGAAVAHHQTLQATLEWSYRLLDPAEQRLLRLLAVFRGGWSIEAVEAMVGCSSAGCAETLDHLGRLVDMSLVEAEDRGTATRFQYLETVRAFARQELVAKGEEDEALGRHAVWAAAFAGEARNALEGQEQALWLQRVTTEMENLRAASDWLESRPDQAHLALQLATDLHGFCHMLGHLDEGLQRLQRALDLPENAAPTPERARALVGAGELAFRMGKLHAAQAFLNESIDIWRAAGDLAGEAQALRRLGNLLDVQGDYPEAQRALEQALEIWQRLDDRWGIAATLNNLGLVARKQGRLEAASEHLQRSLALFETLGTDWAIAVTHANLGDIALDRAQLEAAAVHYQKSLAMASRLEDIEGAAYALEGLANVARHKGELAQAWQLLAQSVRGLLPIQARLEIADWIESALQLALDDGRTRLAARLRGAVDDIRSDMDAPTPESIAPAMVDAELRLRSALGDASFADARAEGRSLGWRHVIDELLARIDASAPRSAPTTEGHRGGEGPWSSA